MTEPDGKPVESTPVVQDALSHRRLLALAIPVTLSNLSTPLLGIVNAAAIGRLGDTAQLGAVALGAVVFDIVFWAFGFLRMATAGLTAQALGRGDARDMRETFWRAGALAAALGLALILLQGVIAIAAIRLMQPGEEVAGHARAYLFARIWSAPFTLANYAILGSLTGRGRTDLGLATQILVNGANIFFSLLFVSGWGWGVSGVGWASVIGEAVGCALGLFFQARAGLLSAPRWRDILRRDAVLRTLTVNRDIFLRTLALIAAIAFFTRQGARAGDVTLAANAVLQNLFLVGAFFLDGFATATEQMAGWSAGARDRAGFNRAVRLGLIWCAGFGAAASILFWLGGGAFIDFISTSPEVRATARHFLIFAAIAPFAGALAFLYDGVFIGATWTRAMRDCMVIALLIAAVLYVALLPFGNTGLWLAFLGFFAARGLTQAFFYPGLERATFNPPSAMQAVR